MSRSGCVWSCRRPEFDADLKAYWREHPELDCEPGDADEPDIELEAAPEPVPEPPAFLQSLAAATRARLPLEFEPENVAELEVSPRLAVEAAS